MVFTCDFSLYLSKDNIPTVLSRQLPRCPHCQRVLINYGYRERRYIDQWATRHTLRIRRLTCTSCHRIHHELPSFLIPGKLSLNDKQAGAFRIPDFPQSAPWH